MRLVLWLMVGALAAHPAAAGEQAAPAGVRKQASASRVADQAIRVDGRLDEEAWLIAAPITDFVQKEPTEGAPPTDAMEVRFVYDDSALYVGARMFSRSERAIQAPLARRDNGETQAEYVLISLDTFLDRRTAYDFGVTASGVRLDRYHSTDRDDVVDTGFNPVWEAKTAIGADGWTAELWIPLSQLRFNQQRDLIWGLNIRRFRPTLDEDDYWVLVPRTERVWASRFGDLHGISALRPPRRIELLPYVASASTVRANRDPRNPFDDGRNLSSRVGADVKMGIGTNLTLDASVNPDFGQVEADPAEVNLSAFETRFTEKRPFFTEGAQLLNINHPNFFYSRRIGARPRGAATGDFVDYPSSSTILASAKLTGRLPSKTSIGILSAVTGSESARVFDLDALAVTRLPVAPRTTFALARVQQEFGALASTAGVHVTAVHRQMSAGDPLADLLSRHAFTAAGDTVLRFKQGEYELRAVGGAAFVDGEPGAIERIQRSSSHFTQRPDKSYALFDPLRTSMSGYTADTRFERTGGRHWIWYAGLKVDTPGFETNDIAQLNGGDGIMPTFDVRYRETQPGRIFRNYSIALNGSNEWSFGLHHQASSLRQTTTLTWSNYWTTSVAITATPRVEDSTLTRGGPLMQRPQGWLATVSLGNRSTSQTRWSGTTTAGGNEDGGTTRRASGTFSFRPGPRWELSMAPFYEELVEPQQYVATIAGGRAETFGSRYVFSFIDRSTISTAYRLGFTLRPDMNLDVYAEPFASSGHYYDFGELLAASGRDRLQYGTGATTIAVQPDGSRVVTAGDAAFTLNVRDFNVRSFRSNVVLRWEWRPGSTLYAVWQEDRSASALLSTRVGVDDMFRSLTAPGSHFFVVKTSFWLPIK
jgi:hypothetical protein